MSTNSLSKILAALPPEWPEDLAASIRGYLQSNPATLVIIDDDPTGAQAVYDIPLLTDWPLESLAAELSSATPAFFILTNSRAMTEEQAAAINQQIGHNLRQAALQTGKKIVVISRGDATLRGHFPAEPEALARGLQTDFDAWLLVPALPGEGRVTIDGVHYLADGDELTLVAETAYARDATFGFRSSSLPAWVEEKTAGKVPAGQVRVLSLGEIRQGGPTQVTRWLLDLPKGAIAAVDAVSSRDLEVFAAGVLAAEAQGRQFLYRSGPGLLSIRMGMWSSRMLSTAMLPLSQDPAGGLIIVGSYVPNTSRQISVLLERGLAEGILVDVPKLLEAGEKEAELLRVVRLADDGLAAGQDVLVYTSRELVTGKTPEESLKIGQVVSNSLIEIVQRGSVCPRYILAKGGVTSNDIATKGLGVKRAMVLGQVTEGVSVWQLGPESRFDRMAYIVFPGNIGQPETLAEVVEKLKREGENETRGMDIRAMEETTTNYIDISVAVGPDLPVWQGDPPVNIYPAASIAQGDPANVSRLDFGAHTGTHVDAPVHFVPGRRGIDELKLETLIGPAYVVDLSCVKHEIHAEDFQRARIPPGTKRLLCKTVNSRLWSEKRAEFDPNFIGISESGARWLVANGIQLVGVDYLGVERFDRVSGGAPTHHFLLEAEVVIVEGLNLADVSGGIYTLICLPVKIWHSDGAPCRAILIKE